MTGMGTNAERAGRRPRQRTVQTPFRPNTLAIGPVMDPRLSPTVQLWITLLPSLVALAMP